MGSCISKTAEECEQEAEILATKLKPIIIPIIEAEIRVLINKLIDDTRPIIVDNT